MKLSKTQIDVLDKMTKGWRLRRPVDSAPYLTAKDEPKSINVDLADFLLMAQARIGYIFCMDQSPNPPMLTYHITQKGRAALKEAAS